MPYVRRDDLGAILSLHRLAEPQASEWLPDDDLHVQAFVGLRPAVGPHSGPDSAPTTGFQQLDADFIRVLEDLIDVLVQRRVINMTDLPAAARDKLSARRDHRRPTALSALQLLGDAPDDDNAALRVFSQFP